MKVRLAGLATLCCAIVLTVFVASSPRGQSQNKNAPSNNNLSQAEQDLLDEINQARAHPAVYASYLEALKPMFNSKTYTRPGHGALTTEEGWTAVAEAISFLRDAKPQGPLSPSIGLRLAAETVCQDQSGTGATGHRNGGGLVEDRAKPFGAWQGGIGESLSYGDDSARERVLTWLIDDGVASRGHRKRMLSGDYKVAGIACSSHPEFGKMCALTLAGGFIDSTAAKAVTSNQNKSGSSLKNNPPTANISATSQTNGAKTSTDGSATNTNKSGTTNNNKSKTTLKPRSF